MIVQADTPAALQQQLTPGGTVFFEATTAQLAHDILAAAKVPTTADVTSGLMAALREVQQMARVSADDIGLVVIGTTHFTNAAIERRRLTRTAVVRLCLPAAQCLMPMVDWPEDLRAVVGDAVYLSSGGVEFDGTPIAPFEPSDLVRIGKEKARLA